MHHRLLPDPELTVLGIQDYRALADGGHLQHLLLSGDAADGDGVLPCGPGGDGREGKGQKLVAVQEKDGSSRAHRDRRRPAGRLMNRLDGLWAERRGLVQGQNPDTSVGGDEHDAIPAESNSGAGEVTDRLLAGDGGSVDRHHPVRPRLEHVIAGLQDLDAIAGRGEPGVELGNVDVEPSHQALLCGGHPDAAVGHRAVGGGHPRRADRKAPDHHSGRGERDGRDDGSASPVSLPLHGHRHGETPGRLLDSAPARQHPAAFAPRTSSGNGPAVHDRLRLRTGPAQDHRTSIPVDNRGRTPTTRRSGGVRGIAPSLSVQTHRDRRQRAPSAHGRAARSLSGTLACEKVSCDAERESS